jgi:hypothetical protein
MLAIAARTPIGACRPQSGQPAANQCMVACQT